MPNVKLSYMYRDYANYRNHNQIIFANPNNLSLKKIDNKLRSKLLDDTWFYASQWDVPDLHFDKYDDELDHAFHEFVSVEYTDEPPTDLTNITQFIAEVKSFTP